MEVLRAIPAFALLPVLIVWFGIGEPPKIAADRPHRDGGDLHQHLQRHPQRRRRPGRGGAHVRRGRLALIRQVVLPGALPGFLVGLRLALTGAWLALIFAETVNAPEGPRAG